MTQRKERSADRFIVEGGRPLNGTVTPAGNKNEALPVLAASLMACGETIIENVPRIRDVTLLLEGLRRLGVCVSPGPDNTISLDTRTLLDEDPDPSMVSRIRGSILLVPALLARTGHAVLPRPGGDRIGRRRVDTHLLALSELGADVTAG